MEGATKTPGKVTFADYAAQVVSSPYGAVIDADSKLSKGLESLNSQLMIHGWTKKPISLDGLSSKDLLRVVGVMFELLGSSVTNLTTLDDLNARYRTLSYENERAQKQISAQTNARARVEAELMAWKARCEETEKQLKVEKETIKEMRDEVVRGKRAMENVKLAAIHDAKKGQMQFDKVQQQLARIANEPGSSRGQGLIMLNAVSGSRTHPVAPSQSTLVEQSVKQLAEIRETLQEEADAFRHVVVSTGNALRDVIAMSEGREDPPRLMHSQFFAPLDQSRGRAIAHSTASSTSHAAIADSRLKALVGHVRGIIANGIDVALHTQQPQVVISESSEEQQQIHRDQVRIQSELGDRIKDLEVEIACVRAKEEEAKRVVEELSRAQVSKEASPPDGIEEQLHRDLREQREMLVEERRKFTEAAMRLGQERRSFEFERNAFLDERRQADMDALQGYLPSSPSDSDPTSSTSTTVVQTEPLPLLPPASPWMSHRPVQPSPLSVSHKPRTPKVHKAGVKKMKTPLSRVVLEKGLKGKGKAPASEVPIEAGQDEALGVLGVEGGRKTNRPKPVSTLGKSVNQDQGVVKQKERLVSGSSQPTGKDGLAQSTKGISGRRTVSGGVTEGINVRISSGTTGVPRKSAWR